MAQLPSFSYYLAMLLHFLDRHSKPMKDHPSFEGSATCVFRLRIDEMGQFGTIFPSASLES